MSMQRLMTILRAPVISEKSSAASDAYRRFVFKVEKDATKAEIKRAVELMFSVEVQAVQVLNVKGKAKRFGKYMGKRSDWKKAYIRLKPGFDIDFANS